MSDSETWYVVKQADGHCEITSEAPANSDRSTSEPTVWGPFPNQSEAIARRVGLIRAGKCQPV